MAKKSQYNIPTLSFLLGSYTGMLSSFGRTPKTVEFFRNQVNGLINIQQVSKLDAQLIFDIIGMQNTDNVKWEKSANKINMFIQAMNLMETYSNNEQVQALKLVEMLKSGSITEDIYQKILNIYNLDIVTTEDKPLNNTFGVLQKIKPNGCVNYSVDNPEWKEFVKKYGNYYYEVRNPDAVCSCDIFYYHCKVSELLSPILNKGRNRVLELLISGSDFDICEADVHDDGCHTSTTYRKHYAATAEAKKFNYYNFPKPQYHMI